MTRVYIMGASSWEEADEHFEAFAATLPQRRRELAEHVAATGGPELDLSVESLTPLNEWFIETVLDRPAPPDIDFRPAWMSPPNPDFTPTPGGPRRAPGWLYLLWEQLGVYLGDVMIEQTPGARWVCWRSPRRGNISNGQPTVDIGVPEDGFKAMSCANGDVLGAWMYLGTGERGMDARPDPGFYLKYFTAVLERRDAYLATKPPRWQAAPTGPRARKTQREPGGS